MYHPFCVACVALIIILIFYIKHLQCMYLNYEAVMFTTDISKNRIMQFMKLLSMNAQGLQSMYILTNVSR